MRDKNYNIVYKNPNLLIIDLSASPISSSITENTNTPNKKTRKKTKPKKIINITDPSILNIVSKVDKYTI